MSKRKSIDIKRKILLCVKENSLTYSQLERKVNTGFRTIKANCKELESFGFLKINRIEKHSANGKPSFSVKITDVGMEFIKFK